MQLDITKLRAETRGCARVTHFNNAGAALMPDPVLHTVTGYLEEEAYNGGYETAANRKEEIEETYLSIARLINAHPGEIALLENATAAWNMAFYSIAFNEGDRILTSVSEYASNYLNYLNMHRQKKLSIEVIPNDEYGQTSIESLQEMMDERVKLISITHIPTNSGLVNPAEEIGDIAGRYNCLYLLDACQSIGQYPVDIEKTGCHMLSATGRKYLRGPRGTGFLYVNSDRLEELSPPFLDLHSAEWTGKDEFKLREDARRFENWEANYAGIIGLNAAVQYLLELGLSNVWRRITKLADRMRRGLETVPGIIVRDTGKQKCGIVTFTVEGKSANVVKQYLLENRINVSVTTKSSTLIDMEMRNLDEAVRASVHYYNTEEEIEKLIRLLFEL